MNLGAPSFEWFEVEHRRLKVDAIFEHGEPRLEWICLCFQVGKFGVEIEITKIYYQKNQEMKLFHWQVLAIGVLWWCPGFLQIV